MLQSPAGWQDVDGRRCICGGME